MYKERLEHQRQLEKYEEKLSRREHTVKSVGIQTHPLQYQSSSSVDAANVPENEGARGFSDQLTFDKLHEKYQLLKNKMVEMKSREAELSRKSREVQASLDTTKFKYERLKNICIYRQSEIDRLQKVEAEQKAQIEQSNNSLNELQKKCNALKLICQSRGAAIEKLSSTGSIVDENTSSIANR